MKVVISHPTSNQFNRAAVNGLLEADMLFEFHTAIASFPGGILDMIGALKPFQEIRRRQFDPAIKPFTHSWPLRELGRQLANKGNLSTLTRHEKGIFSLDAVYNNLDKRIASKIRRLKSRVDGVYAYEDGALYSFTEAKNIGIKCLYDLPIGYWRSSKRLLSVEKQRWPDWAPTLVGLEDSDAKLSRKDEELALADCIIVASSFTAKTLQEFPGKLAPIEVIPYAFPPVAQKRNYTLQNNNRKLKLLFVGGLSQRKGIADLFTAVEDLDAYVELTVVGKKSGDCKALDDALAKHRWIPSLSHSNVLELMRSCDVLIFPSVFEGFGLVISEAMSQGTPVITTDRTAGPDIIEDGHTGWLIEASSIEKLKNAIEEILRRPAKIAEVGQAAMQKAAERSWKAYEMELTEALQRYI